MEPLRQSLMTLHTMLGSRPRNVDENGQRQTCKVSAKRKWYKGQWRDCRDTVDQWFEATVVDILSPNDILKSANAGKICGAKSSALSPARDRAIPADDIERTRKLLLESSDDKFNRTLSQLNNDD